MFSEKSKWIGCSNESSPIIIKQFYMDELQRGIIDICGLGYYELFVNGERVGNDYFKPVVSDYSERDFSEFLYPLQDKTSHTIYYNTYNITNNLRKGKNTLAVMLGNGEFLPGGTRSKRVCFDVGSWKCKNEVEFIGTIPKY